MISGFPVSAGIVAAEGALYAASHGGMMVAFDAETGDLLWRRDALGPLYADPIMDEETLYVASLDNYVYALSRADGSTLWRYRLGVDAVGTPALMAARCWCAAPIGCSTR